MFAKLITIHVPMSICNFRCSYCYLSHRSESYQNEQIKYKYSPDHVAKALSPDRMGGVCHMVLTADGETLLAKDIDAYIKVLVESGHFVEIVTNMTITPVLDRILKWDRELLKRIEFKCSFHYLELVKKNLLETFARNVNNAWMAGASINVEVTPCDELIPYIDDVLNFSLQHFGAYPHLTIARDDKTKAIGYLTNLSDSEYEKAWSKFDSGFWKYKRTIFGKKQTEFCYAGLWSANVNLGTGQTSACYYEPIGNIFENINEPFHFRPIGRCSISHCYNGHLLLVRGLIPNATSVKYGDIRNRVRADGTEWLQPELKAFFNTKLTDSNMPWSKVHRDAFILKKRIGKRAARSYKSLRAKVGRIVRGRKR